MDKYYTVFKCKRCGKEMILITGEVSSTKAYGNYISCSHCGCKKLIKTKETDSFKECMTHSAYKREGRAFRQVRQE